MPYEPSGKTADAIDFLNTCKDELLATAEQDIQLRRDDYKEFLELSVVFLTGTHKGFTFKRPGALHKARWMAKMLYAVKICLFEKEIAKLPRNTITFKHQVTKIRDFVTFITHIYCAWWMAAPCAVDAPWNDLLLYQHLLKYDVVNALISASAVKAFKRHLWYLTSEMVPMALFSQKVPVATKKDLAARLLELKPTETCTTTTPQHRFGTGFGKPKFLEISADTTLPDLLDCDSWFFFTALKLDPTFLTIAVEEWMQCDAYNMAAKRVRAINVVNDCAERGVKLSSGFLATARSEGHYQNILQVVENDRKSRPNLRTNMKQ